MTLRDAVELDLPAIVAIYNAAIPMRVATADLEPVAVESRFAWFRRHTRASHPIWVAEVDGEVAGWLSFEPFYGRPAYSGTAELSVYVDGARQRRGVGRALLGEAVRRAPALGLETLLGFIFAHNEPSLRLFAELGFVRWAHLPRVARLDAAARDLVIVGRSVAA